MPIEQVQLADGRVVWKDGQGRWHDAATGKFTSAEQMKSGKPGSEENYNSGKSLEEYTSDAVLRAAKDCGLEAETPGEVLAEVIGVQAGIALNKDDPAKAIAAARLLTGNERFKTLFEPGEVEDQPWFVLGRELACELLTLIKEEKDEREGLGE